MDEEIEKPKRLGIVFPVWSLYAYAVIYPKALLKLLWPLSYALQVPVFYTIWDPSEGCILLAGTRFFKQANGPDAGKMAVFVCTIKPIALCS